MKIYKCNTCGNIITMLEDSGVTPVCCGDEMTLLEAGTSDGAKEKHVPVVEITDGHVKVTVGETRHPMLTGHHIMWIMLVTNKGFHVINLTPMDDPVACFDLCKGEKVIEAYEYCNLHGLWKAKVTEACGCCGIPS